MKLNDYIHELQTDPQFKEEYSKLQINFDIATAVMKARIKKGWTQAMLAEKVGTKQANISNLEAANANPTLDFLKRVFAELDLYFEVNSHDQKVAASTFEKQADFSILKSNNLSCREYASSIHSAHRI